MNKFLKGWRTFTTCAGVFVVGALNVVGTFDLHPIVSYFISDEKQIGVVMCILGIVFAVLRYVTTTELGRPDQDDTGMKGREQI